ncbi:Pre-mRNA splicing Prp18-interacting factor-domain-containing protein [Morchella snyderi]|nr:Pre-mRNA splicing Prp18-interacting factor-domain-containing protein [Morchella snyderi]
MSSSSSSLKHNPEKQAKNEYIPHFIAKRPFYVDDNTEGDYLEHQRLQKPAADTLSTQKWYDRGAKTTRATKYRKGACTNCGAMTHITKDCLSRPRKLGARWTGEDIQPDEAIQTLELGWDGKRDRWNGYDAREHQRVVDDHLRMESLRKQSEATTAAATATAAAAAAAATDEYDTGDYDASGDKYAEESETPGQGYDAANRISTRNLRIREDTAKYLLNLDLDSAKYDPKTRTMVDRGATSDQAAALVAEDNFMRSSGDAAEFEKLQRAAWETRERGDKSRMHLQANPTEAERLKRTQAEAAAARRADERRRLLARYGGEEHLGSGPAAGALMEEEERYVEYTPEGQVKGREKVCPRSKYAEDVLAGNHTAVWGSWWRAGRWGYLCCRSHTRNSYCTGEEGIRAAEIAEGMRLGLVEPVAPRRRVEELVVRGKEEAEAESATDKGKRKLAQMRDGVTEEDMELFMKQRRLAEDPMAGFVDVV